jgi:glutathione synthase
MKILILVNEILEIKVSQLTCEIAYGFVERGRSLFIGDVLGLSWDQTDSPSISVSSGQVDAENIDAWLQVLKNRPLQRVSLLDFDLIWVRTNPGRDKNRGWAHDVALDLLFWVEERGVCVINPTQMLRKASSKLYLQAFSSSIRPRSIISHQMDELHDFVSTVHARGEAVILKPLRGTGGKGVFIVRPDDLSNLNQIIETLSQQDFVIAQEYLKAGQVGDVRLLLLKGEPIEVDGKIALVARLRQGSDIRSNIEVGGKPSRSDFSIEKKKIVGQVSQKLKQDGVFLAGLDIIGDKIVEINVFSPGGVRDAGRFAKRDFLTPILEAAEFESVRKKEGVCSSVG